MPRSIGAGGASRWPNGPIAVPAVGVRGGGGLLLLGGRGQGGVQGGRGGRTGAGGASVTYYFR